MLSKTPSFQFWYEFASTYSYLTVMRIDELTKQAGIAVEWKPFLLGPIFKEQGWSDSPFNIYPTKGRYMWRDLERRAFARNLVFQKPSQFPRNGLLAARVAFYGMSSDWGEEFTKRVFQANFVQDLDISNETIIKEILALMNLNSDIVFQEASSDQIKNSLREQTQEAKSLGIFGAPSFLVGEELFWGDDRLEEAIQWHKALTN